MRLFFSVPAPKDGWFLLLLLLRLATPAKGADFQHSYAVVVGIDEYSAVHKQHLSYARKDAEAIASYLRNQGYAVTPLYDQQATKHNILDALHSVAVQLRADDRVVMFLSGHGANERIGDELWGYFIPYDGADMVSYVSYTELQDASRQMGNARHQLFIMDACFAGLLLKTRSGGGVSPNVPNYIDEVTKRITRQALTAGGDMQEVLDTGPNGHSVFTSALLEGLNGAADFNRDGYITFAELESYVGQRASNRFQIPAAGVLPGNAGGEFVFRSPLGAREPLVKPEAVPQIVVKRGDTEQLARAKELLKASRFSEALPLFQRAAATGNPEALKYMGEIYASGWGVPQDDTQAVAWFRKAADAGNTLGMANLGVMYADGRGGLPKDEAQAVSWYRKAADAGEPLGMNNLGFMYETGRGVAKDLAQAASWYRRAAAAGNADAKAALQRLGQ
jgi:hypothetical protein